METRWQKYFAESHSGRHSLLELAVEHWTYNAPLYHHIRRAVNPPARILDIGSGFGFSDIYLAACGYQITGIDYDQGVLEKSWDVAKHFDSDVTFEQGDAFDLSKHHGKFDLVYSAGVVEHFDRDVTVKLIAEQAKCAPLVLVLIPSKYTVYAAPLADERLYTPRQLAAMVNDAGLHVVDQFGYGDVPVRSHRLMRGVLPYAAWRLLRDRVGLSMGMVCIGSK